MGTSNFHRGNASKIFAFGMECEDEFDYDIEKEDIVECLLEEGFVRGHGVRAMDGDVVAYRPLSCVMYGVEIEATIDIVLHAGYYQGASLDWEMSFSIGYSDWDSLDSTWFSTTVLNDIEEQIADEYNAGLAKIGAPLVLEKLKHFRDELIEHAENALSECTQPLKVAARFSNGETIYTEA